MFSCEERVVEKPDKLIEKEVMIDIMYDLSLLQAIRGSNNQSVLDSNGIDPATYIYKKYKIDSLQFAQNNRYYASDVKSYNRMFNKLNQRILDNKAAADSLEKKNSKVLEAKKADSLKKKQELKKAAANK